MSSACDHPDAIAIVGLAGRFPGAGNPNEFWERLREGADLVRRFSNDELAREAVPARLLEDPRYVKARGVIAGIEFFDESFFGLLPREAQLLDPQQRLMLECAWEAFESAGIRTKHGDARIGVFASVSPSSYLDRRDHLADEPFALDGNYGDLLASRIAYKLDLRGPCMMVQTACSSSLVAVHVACQSLLTGECDAVLAGGSSIGLPQIIGSIAYEGGIRSPDGRCRSFDSHANGLVAGNAVGAVVLKRLSDAIEDGDPVRAVIRGSAVVNDGANRVGYTAPSADGQSRAIREALHVSSLSPTDISYIEGHGSGTALGDAIELSSLSDIFGDNDTISLGSVKSNIGHADVAAGIVGLIKTVLCLEHRELVPSLHFSKINPHAAHGPIEVVTTRRDWRAEEPLRAGVSSFGMGGTNAHVILEEPPQVEHLASSLAWQVLPLSARSPAALETMTTELAEALREDTSLPLSSVAWTLQSGRELFDYRRSVVCRTAEDGARALETRDPMALRTGQTSDQRAVVFLLPGVGERLEGQITSLYRDEIVFRNEIDRLTTFVHADLGVDLRTILCADRTAPLDFRSMVRGQAQSKHSASVVHVSHCVVELALASQWQSIGVVPSAIFGYSLGEYVAACLAGVFSREQLLHLVVARARLLESVPSGAMTAIAAPSVRVQEFVAAGVTIAGLNGPGQCVASGTLEGIFALEGRLSAQEDIAWKRVDTQHAFHSPQMRPMASALTEIVVEADPQAPTTPFISNLTGTWITTQNAQDPAYWADQLCSPVRFTQGIETLQKTQPGSAFVEVGLGRVLCSLTAPLLPHDEVLLASLPSANDSRDDSRHFTDTLANLWRAGVDIQWSGRYSANRPRKVPLPTYPFERTRHWVGQDGPENRAARVASPASQSPPPARSTSDQPTANISYGDDPEAAIQEVWQRVFGIPEIGVHENFFDIGGHSLLAVQLLYRLRIDCELDLPVSSLYDNPTIAELARLSTPSVNIASLKKQVESLDRNKRQHLLGEHVVAELARSLACSQNAIRDADNLSALGLGDRVADFMATMKHTLGVPLFPHEILARTSVTELTDLLEEALFPADEDAHDAGEFDTKVQAALQRDRSPADLGLGPRTKLAGPMVFLLSSARAGSTLLRVMLAGHTQLFCPPEMHLLMYNNLQERQQGLPSAHFGSGLDRALRELGTDTILDQNAEAAMWDVYRSLQKSAQPQFLVDKSPSYAERPETLDRIDRWFETPKIIYLTRHPSAVIESYVRNRFHALASQPVGDPHACAEFHWVTHNQNVLDFLARSQTPVIQLKYEDLVSEPEPVMRKLTTFLGLEFGPAVLHPYDGNRMIDGVGDPNIHQHEGIDAKLGNAWRQTTLTRPLGRHAHALAARLGYAL